MITRCLVNGSEREAMVPVTDSSVLRGDGCFEVLKAYSGHPFALARHLRRLARSAERLEIELPSQERLAGWITEIAEETGDGVVRVVVTRGSAVPGEPGTPLVIVFGHSVTPDPGPARLLPVVAPWHAAGAEWELAGAKVLSYAPNMASTRHAVTEGFGDALLLGIDRTVLEGPTFSVAWVREGVVETPSLGLGILDSITRDVVLELASDMGLEVTEGKWPLERLERAEEVMALSTVREVQPVSAVGEWSFPEGPVTADLARGFAQLVAREVRQGSRSDPPIQ